MRYVVIINLDYENHEHGKLKSLFTEVSAAMQEKGYVVDGRRFTIDVEPPAAEQLARSVLDEIEQRYNQNGESVFAYVKEFFGFAPENAVNLLLPPDDDIEVSELEEVDGINLINFLKS